MADLRGPCRVDARFDAARSVLSGLTMGCNIAQGIRYWAVSDPDRVALVLADEGGRALSYGALDLRARRTAAYLGSLGLGPGDRLALSVPNGLPFLDAWFGGLYAGCTMLPIPPMSAAPELAARMQHARCRALIAETEALAPGGVAAQALLAAPLARGLDAASLCQGSEAVDVPRELAADAVALLLYTSGTTGTPKGAMITHASLASHTAALVHHVLRLGSGDRVLACLPLTHSYGIRMTLLAPYYAGACSVLVSRFRAGAMLALLREQAISWFPGVPTMFHALAHESSSGAPYPALRWCLSAGAPLPREIRLRAEAQLGVPLRQGFGLTEATFSSVATPDDPGAADTVGRPVFGVELRVVDEHDRVLPPNVPGQVCVRGQNVMAGYLDDPAATAEALRDGWLYSGDVGMLDDAGRLTIVDRIKDMVIRGGFNVYPAEVEAVLVEHPGVHDAVVVGVPDERYGEEVLAALVVTPGASLSWNELAEFCRQRLSRVKLPRLVTTLPTLPVGASGKVLRREVRRRALAGELLLEPLGKLRDS
jgi:long-chain acyl-CoA synthetase